MIEVSSKTITTHTDTHNHQEKMAQVCVREQSGESLADNGMSELCGVGEVELNYIEVRAK